MLRSTADGCEGSTLIKKGFNPNMSLKSIIIIIVAFFVIILSLIGIRSCNFEKPVSPQIPIKPYTIVSIGDSSIKALTKNLSEYSISEIESLPLNIRKVYKIVVDLDIIKEDLELTMKNLVAIETKKNPDIDEIAVFAYKSKEDAEIGALLVGKMEWCPNGEWELVTPDIASTNDRSSYKYIFDINEEIGNVPKENMVKNNDFNFVNSEEYKDLAVYIVMQDAKKHDASFKIYKTSEDTSSFAEYVQNESTDSRLTYKLKIPTTITRDGNIYCAFLIQQITIYKNKPNIKNIYEYIENNKIIYWVSFYYDTKVIQRTCDRKLNANKLEEIVKNQNNYNNFKEQFKIITTEPILTIKISDISVENSFDDVIIKENKRALVYSALLTFVHTEFNNVKIIAVPMEVKLNPNKVVKQLDEYKVQVDVNRKDLLEYLKEKYGINEYEDLIYKESLSEKNIFEGDFNSRCLQILFGNQGGSKLDDIFNFMKNKSRSEHKVAS